MNKRSNFEIECSVLSDLYMNYRDSELLAEFIEYNDIGIPLAHFVHDGLIKELEAIAENYIAETYQTLFEVLGIPCSHEYGSLEEVLKAKQFRQYTHFEDSTVPNLDHIEAASFEDQTKLVMEILEAERNLEKENVKKVVTVVLSWPDKLSIFSDEIQLKIYDLGLSILKKIGGSLGEDYWEEMWKRSPIESFELRCGRNASSDQVLSELLASDEWDELRSELAQNPAISPKVLEMYSKDELSEIRCAVSEHRASTIEILESLAIDKDIDVRTAVFNNPKSTEEIRASASILGIRTT